MTLSPTPGSRPGTPTTTRALKALSLEFRDVSSRALRSDEGEAGANLRRLLSFVAREPLLAAAVAAAAAAPAGDVGALWDAAREAEGPHATGRLVLPEDPQEELGLLHAVVGHLATSDRSFDQLTFGYGGHYNSNDAVEEMLEHVVGPYVTALNRVIELALLDANDPTYGPARGLAIHVSGGTNQLMVAQDAARVDAAQHVTHPGGPDTTTLVAQLGDALRAFRDAAQDASVDAAARAEAVEITAAVSAELERPAPSRYTLRKAREHLEDLAAGGKAVGTLAAQAGPLAALVADLWDRLGQRLGQ